MKTEDKIYNLLQAFPEGVRGELAYAYMAYIHGDIVTLSKRAEAYFGAIKYTIGKAKAEAETRSLVAREWRKRKTTQNVESQAHTPNLFNKDEICSISTTQNVNNQGNTANLFNNAQQCSTNTLQPFEIEAIRSILLNKLEQNGEQKGKAKAKAKAKEKSTPLYYNKYYTPLKKEKEKEKENEKGKGLISPDNNKLLSCPIDVVEAAQSNETTSLNTSFSVDAPHGIHCAAEPSEPKQGARMKRPSVDEVQEYCDTMGYTFSAEEFVAFYESNGWKVGKNPMKSWQAACRTWQGSKPKKRPKDALPDTLPAAEWDSFRTWLTNNAPSLPPVTPDNYLDMKAAVHRRLQVLADILLAIARMPHVDSVVAEVKRLCNQQPYYNLIWN